MTYDQVDRIHHLRPVIGEHVRHRETGEDGTVAHPTEANRRRDKAPTVRVAYPKGVTSPINATIGYHDPRSLIWLDRTPGEQLPEIEEAQP